MLTMSHVTRFTVHEAPSDALDFLRFQRMPHLLRIFLTTEAKSPFAPVAFFQNATVKSEAFTETGLAPEARTARRFDAALLRLAPLLLLLMTKPFSRHGFRATMEATDCWKTHPRLLMPCCSSGQVHP